MERRTFLKTTAAGLLVAASPLRPAFAQGKKYRIGFSQSTTLEPWRVQFNKDMKREADLHPEIELLVSDGQDKTEKQDMTAREVFDDERATWWERAVAAYPDYADYQEKTDRTIPVFVLEPVE